MADTKYPQSAEPNEYRYLDYPWLNEVATGLTAGAEKTSGRNMARHPCEGARCTSIEASGYVACW